MVDGPHWTHTHPRDAAIERVHQVATNTAQSTDPLGIPLNALHDLRRCFDMKTVHIMVYVLFIGSMLPLALSHGVRARRAQIDEANST